MIDLVHTKRDLRKLISHQMISNALAWCQGVKVSLVKVRLAAMTIQDLGEIFEVQFVIDTTKVAWASSKSFAREA